jgi:hypothetical protein
MKCNYCKKTEVCQGSYPEGCFLEHQIAKIDYKLLNHYLLRRIGMIARSSLCPTY